MDISAKRLEVFNDLNLLFQNTYGNLYWGEFLQDRMAVKIGKLGFIIYLKPTKLKNRVISILINEKLFHADKTGCFPYTAILNYVDSMIKLQNNLEIASALAEKEKLLSIFALQDLKVLPVDNSIPIKYIRKGVNVEFFVNDSGDITVMKTLPAKKRNFVKPLLVALREFEQSISGENNSTDIDN